MLAFVAVMLGSVGFDGLSRAPFWQNLRADLAGPYVVDAPRTAELLTTALDLAGLIGCILLVALAYLGATKIAERMIQSERPLAPEFLQSLVPIALVYAVAHYFTAFIITGQYIFSLASDPFGFGWDLFGTVTYSPNIAPLPPNIVWYVQVGALVAGHVAGLAVAHDRAVTILPAAGRAPLPVRHARPDGGLHGRWDVAALAGLTPFLAHGGVGGAIVEALLAISIAGIFLAVYLRERRAGRSRSDDDEA